MPVHFVLKPGTWTGADEFLCRPVLGERQGRPTHLPWVTIATGHEGSEYELVRREGLSSQDAKALIGEANEHAASSRIEWQVTEQSGFLFFKKPSQVRAIVHQPPGATPDVMDDLSAELLVSKAALAGAADVLKSDELIAVVPKRGWLLVIAGAAGEFPKMMKMNQIAEGVHGRAGDDAISPYAFFLKDRQLIGANVIEGSGGYMHLNSPKPEAWQLG